MCNGWNKNWNLTLTLKGIGSIQQPFSNWIYTSSPNMVFRYAKRYVYRVEHCEGLLVFRRKDLCEAKHDVVCVRNFAQNWTILGGGKSTLPIWWLQIWGKSSLPIFGGGGVNRHCRFGCNWYLMIWGQIGSDDLPPLPRNQQGRLTPNLQSPNRQCRFTPPPQKRTCRSHVLN